MNWFSRLWTRIQEKFKASCAETCCERLQIDCRQGRDCPYRNYGANASTSTSSEAAVFMRKKR